MNIFLILSKGPFGWVFLAVSRLFVCPSMMWVGIGTAVLGTGTSIYGADKARKTANQTNDRNIAAAKAADDRDYQIWLESQGLGPDGKPINTWLPRYATLNSTFGQPRGRKFRRITGTTFTPSMPGAPIGGTIAAVRPSVSSIPSLAAFAKSRPLLN